MKLPERESIPLQGASLSSKSKGEVELELATNRQI